MKIFKIVVLTISGLALFYACSMRLFHPSGAVFLQSFFENPANHLETHIDLASEIRGVGAVMLLGGVWVLMGILKPRNRQSSFKLASLIFGGVFLGRVISLFVDGMPHEHLMRAAMVEGILAVLNIFCLLIKEKDN